MKRLFSLVSDIAFISLQALLYFLVKLKNSGVELASISYVNLGNIILLAFFALKIAVYSGVLLKKFFLDKRIIYSFLILELVFLTGAFLLAFNLLAIKEIFVFYYSLRKIIIAFSLCLFLFLSVYGILYFGKYLFKYQLSLSLNFIYAILFFPAILIFFFLYSLQGFDSSDKYYSLQKEKADICVVLGAAVWKKETPSPILYGRIKKARDLYINGFAKKILLTGSNAPGEFSEAKVAYNTLRRLGVPSNVMLYEEHTRSTLEQIFYLKKLQEKNDKLRLIIVSDNFHLARIKDMIDYYKVNADLIASDYNLKLNKWIYYRTRESVALFIFHFLGL